MTIKKKLSTIVILAFFFSSLFGQNPKEIKIEFKKNAYLKIATDSIKVLYERQKEYYKSNKSSIDPFLIKNAISLNYNFNDLDFYIIPKYRIYENAKLDYTCESNIEDFIAFKDRCKYQTVVIKSDKKILSSVEVPNDIFEYQRIYNPGLLTNLLADKDSYENYYLRAFVVHKKAFMKLLKRDHKIFISNYMVYKMSFLKST